MLPAPLNVQFHHQNPPLDALKIRPWMQTALGCPSYSKSSHEWTLVEFHFSPFSPKVFTTREGGCRIAPENEPRDGRENPPLDAESPQSPSSSKISQPRGFCPFPAHSTAESGPAMIPPPPCRRSSGRLCDPLSLPSDPAELCEPPRRLPRSSPLPSSCTSAPPLLLHLPPLPRIDTRRAPIFNPDGYPCPAVSEWCPTDLVPRVPTCPVAGIEAALYLELKLAVLGSC